MAKLSAQITYNSLTLNTATPRPGGARMSGYLVDQFDPWSLEVAQYLEKRALADGVDASDVYLGRRTLSMIVAVFGSTWGDFWDKSDDLMAAFSPRLAYNADTANLGFLALDFYQPTADIASWPTSAYPDGIPLRYYCRPTAVNAVPIDRDRHGGDDNGGLSERFRIGLVARTPYKVAVSATSTTTTASNLGNFPARAEIIIRSNAFTGNASITIGSNVLSVSIDAENTTYRYTEDGVFYKGSNINMSLLYQNSHIFAIEPGSNSKGGSGLTASQSTVIFRHTFT